MLRAELCQVTCHLAPGHVSVRSGNIIQTSHRSAWQYPSGKTSVVPGVRDIQLDFRFRSVLTVPKLSTVIQGVGSLTSVTITPRTLQCYNGSFLHKTAYN